MAELLIGRTVKIGGVPADADTAPVLRDASNTFGLRLDATGAVIVPAGTAFTRTAAGVYQLAVSGLIAGASYTYWIETTIGGQTARVEKSYTAPAASTGAYQSVADADALAAILPGLTAWAAATAPAKAAALLAAADRIDGLRFQGRKYADAQARQFPRIDGNVVLDTDPVTQLAIVPLRVRKAELIEADSILTGTRDTALDARQDGLSGQSVGSMSESYFDPTGKPASPLCRQAMTLLDRYRLRTGRLL